MAPRKLGDCWPWQANDAVMYYEEEQRCRGDGK